MLIDIKTLIEKYDLDIKGVIHCGAHNAEEFPMYKSIGVKNIVWVEANPEKSEFCKEYLKNEKDSIVINEAVNDIDGEKIEFNITNNGESSSILKLKNHKNYYPQIDVVKKIEVSTKRLDTIFSENNLSIDKYNFLNLDLQGVELRAIKSLGTYIENIDYIYTEINRQELYEGCDIVDDIDSFLLEKGFIRMETAWTHANWGDALYVKGPKLKIIVTTFNNENWVQTNIESILEQGYKNYDVLYVDDASSDTTKELVKYLVEDNKKFNLIFHDKNMSKSYSFTEYVKSFVLDNEVLVFIDGDDWIPYNDTFQKIVEYYIKNKVWVAYSKMVCYPSLSESPSHGKDHPENIHKYNLYRQYPYTASHIKTMKGFLFKNINKQDLIYNNEWIRFGDDVAIMCSAMEQSPKEKIGVMDFVGYVYNESKENSERNHQDFIKGRDGENYIKSIKPYSVIKDNSDKYISPRMLGRLGNQMFQIAAAYSFSIDNNCSMKVSTKNGVFESLIGEVSNPHIYKDSVFSKIEFIQEASNYDIWKEPSFKYTPISYKFENNLYLEGHFQSEKYFAHNKEKILDLFEPTQDIKDYIFSKYGELLNKNTVSLHIRRGDYLVSQDHHPICPLNYYQDCLNKLSDIDIILVFSDDKEYAKKTFTQKNVIIIQDEKDYIDLYLMSMSKHNIIANSSFSWWGAWLNKNKDKKVFAPKNWFGPALVDNNIEDLIPSYYNLI
jgi:FkbM family methyltransferase